MLLEIDCTIEHFMEFLNTLESEGIRPDFAMRGADSNSGFGSIAQHSDTETFTDEGEDEGEENPIVD